MECKFNNVQTEKKSDSIKTTVRPCPFCGCIPKLDGEIITHYSSENCIISNTQYELELWNKRQLSTEECMKKITSEIKKDNQYYFAWQSNIAVPIQDRLKHVEDIYEISNLCAKDFLNNLTR